MTKEEINQYIKEYIEENLTVGIDVSHSYSYHGRRVEVKIFLDGDLISWASDRIPDDD